MLDDVVLESVFKTEICYYLSKMGLLVEVTEQWPGVKRMIKGEMMQFKKGILMYTDGLPNDTGGEHSCRTDGSKSAEKGGI